MHCRLIAVVGFVLATGPLAGLTPVLAQGSPPEPVTAFVDVAVIPMDRERVLPHQTVVVRGAQIVVLGPRRKVEIPAGAVRIDGRGKFLIPGLADMHVHIPGRRFLDQLIRGPLDTAGLAAAERELFLAVANGVTTVRIMHGWADHLTLRARAARGELLSPRLYVARRAPENDSNWGSNAEENAKFVAADVAAAKAAGYDFYKAHGEIKGTAEFDSLVAVAHRVGLRIVGHAPDSDGTGARPIERVIQGGYASLEHINTFAVYVGGASVDYGKLAEHLPELRALATAMRRAGVWFCPTLVASFFYTSDVRPAELWGRELRYYPPAFVARKRPSAEMLQQQSESEPARRLGLRKVFAALHEVGVGLLLGTDEEANVYGIPGFAVHRELWAMVQAGLTPYEALATGTRNVAQFLGTLDSAGTVGVGKRADLVLLSGNPLHDIRHTAEPAGVMLGGRWLSRAELDARLQPLEGTIGGD